MSTMNAIRALRDAGHFKRALEALGDATVSGKEGLTLDVLRAELLERVGHYPQSLAIMEVLVRKQGLSREDRCGCELVMARLNIEHGDIELAIAQLQRSIAMALECDDIERLCWAQLRLLLILSDRSGPDSIVPLLSDLRVRVLQSGQPGIMAALHIHLAETEAKRGLLRNARRHLDIGKRALATSNNRWLEALAENVECGLETMRSNFTAALKHAKRCLDLAEDAGTSSVRESALGNLGNLCYLTGQFDEAANYLSRANAAQQGSDTWAACVDTLAHICLARGDLDESSRLLDTIDAAINATTGQSRYVYRYAQFTRVHLLSRQGKTIAALRHLGFVLVLATQSKDQFLTNMTLLLKAEILQEAGQISECMTVLRDLVPSIASQSPDFLAHYERVLACAMARTGQFDAAESHRRRAARVYSGLQHQAGQLELERCWRNACAAQKVENRLTDSDGEPNRSTVSLSDVASIMLHVGRPELIAREFIDLLRRTDCVQFATALARSVDGSVEVIVHTGESRDVTTRHEQRLAVGTAREREIDILLAAKADLESIATVNAVVLVLATLQDLERAHAEREERATLWPIDELPADGQGPVAVGHMRETIARAKKVAHANISVLITGESGTGKEVVARAIHAHSTRARRPFIPFNCAAIPREMLESQLFGHRRGAFTGADRDNPGVIRSAREGTLFLDEIGELSLEMQPKLLRFLESREICPVGESIPFVVDIRIIAATNSKLENLVKDGRFREDLFYRLNVIRLSVKPLRERRDEIPTLVSHFLMRAAEEFRKSHLRIAEETMERLVLYGWPGNVRQLQNEVRRMAAFAESHSVLGADALSSDIGRQTGTLTARPTPVETGQEMPLPPDDKLSPTLASIERETIRTALRENNGRVDVTAKALGISRKGLYLKRRRLGL